VNRGSAGGPDPGSTTVELVLLTPLVLALLGLVVGLGRINAGRSELQSAAREAARAASQQAGPVAAHRAAVRATGHSLAGATACRSAALGLSRSRDTAGELLSVTLTCRLRLAAVTGAGLPGSVTLTAHATSPVDTYAAARP
jgi:Flp pilus assembly protein TadG